MTEADAIERVDEPVTTSSLATDLRDLRVSAGDTPLVHSSLSAIGWVSGGPQAVVLLLVVLLSPGTIWGPVALVGGACGFVVATLGIVVDFHPTFAGYAVVVGMALVLLSGVLETARRYSLGIR